VNVCAKLVNFIVAHVKAAVVLAQPELDNAREVKAELEISRQANTIALNSLMRSFDEQYLKIERDLSGLSILVNS
jgi:hypothetical protein